MGLFAFLIGTTVGGIFWTYFVGKLIGRMWSYERPDDRARNAAAAGFLFTCALAAFGSGNPFSGIYYLPGSAIAYFLLRRSYRAQWVEDDSTFD